MASTTHVSHNTCSMCRADSWPAEANPAGNPLKTGFCFTAICVVMMRQWSTHETSQHCAGGSCRTFFGNTALASYSPGLHSFIMKTNRHSAAWKHYAIIERLNITTHVKNKLLESYYSCQNAMFEFWKHARLAGWRCVTCCLWSWHCEMGTDGAARHMSCSQIWWYRNGLKISGF